ncbi:hypothetical protein EJ02DRAFT_494360 [Clathrospora elynae]|uniref:Uncharacterized protein n=1 Tax=Clathrospora elynae TaxID=706981 RepID=A0A6A5SLF2_9PLEO|nr:hypothetical protein EJ02DRAFT_494360 [Clathrospora elynae]
MMAIGYLRQAALVAAFTKFATAQESTIIPSDLTPGFIPNGDTVQVSYTNDAVDGFQDDVSKEHTFALGDSSGIAPRTLYTLYTLIMLQTTCPSVQKLHYVCSKFKYNFDITNIDIKSAPLLDYKAPGSLGEKRDIRQYTFLMYMNPAFNQIESLKLPAENEDFDERKFQDYNGFGDADAGMGIAVRLGGGKAAETLPSVLPTPFLLESSTVGVRVRIRRVRVRCRRRRGVRMSLGTRHRRL